MNFERRIVVETRKMKGMALLGFIGGLLFAIGDCLVYMTPNIKNANGIFTDWEQMGMWRFSASVYLGCFGSILLIIGFHSLYKVVQVNCSVFIKGISQIIAAGIMLTAVGHFLIACIVPMTYKSAIMAGMTTDAAQKIMMVWEESFVVLEVLIATIVIILQSLFMIAMILRGQLECPKWMVILNPIFLIIISIPLSILFQDTVFAGVTDGFESLGEGALYIAVFWHWKKTALLESDTNNTK